MFPDPVQHFNSILSLKTSIENEIKDLEEKIKNTSTVLGEKIRSEEKQSQEDSGFEDLKQKLEDKPSEDDKKKKKTPAKQSSKKSKDTQWYELDGMLIYNGSGPKGEFEIYFKGIDDLKSKLENLKKTLATLEGLINKGLKDDIGCIIFQNYRDPIQISLIKQTNVRKGFSFKSIYSEVMPDNKNTMEVGIV
jgi:regulator of replication initiation timing